METADWFQYNSTYYGPWPLWNIITNYTFPRIPRHVSQTYISQHEEGSPATFGLATGTLLILTFGSNAKQLHTKNAIHTLLWPSWQWMNQIQNFLVVSILVPLVTFIFLVLALYKQLVAYVLQRDLLDGPDAVWALDVDEPNSLAIINILVLIEGHMSLDELQDIVKKEMLPVSRKLSMLRKYSLFGYFYWESNNEADVKSLVRMMPVAAELSEDELRDVIDTVSNLPLPNDHTAGWELLLGPVVTATSEEPTRTALLFRVHHSLGDGPALCDIFLSTICNSALENTAAVTSLMMKKMKRTSPAILDIVMEGSRGLLQMATLPNDMGSLHGPQLSGNKRLTWSSSSRLLEAARGIRAISGASFTAGLLAALSTTLQEYASEAKPVTVVIPARMPQKPTDFKLNNNFSMIMVQCVPPLPEHASALERVRAADAALKAACTPGTLIASNLIVHLLAGLLPRRMASHVLYSRQCTAVLSNLPGPTQRVSLASRPVTQIAFWVPHRGITGVGASALSYAGHLTLSLTIDEALLVKSEDANLLMIAWEQNLLRLEHELRFAICV